MFKLKVSITALFIFAIPVYACSWLGVRQAEVTVKIMAKSLDAGSSDSSSD